MLYAFEVLGRVGRYIVAGLSNDRNVSSFRFKHSKTTELFGSEEGVITILRNTGSYLPIDTA